MKKKSVFRKVLAVTLSAVTLLGTGFTTAGGFVGTNAAVSAANASKYGIVGNMTAWGASNDFPMYETEPGIYVGKTDVLSAGEYYEFKVRADEVWLDCWGVYEEDYNRTYNSQTNIEISLLSDAAIAVKLDTTGDDDYLWPVSYAIVKDGSTNYDWIYTGKPTDDDPIGPVDDPIGPVDDPIGPVDDPIEPIDDPIGPVDDPIGPVDDPIENDFAYGVTEDNTIKIKKYTGNGGDVVIPDTIDGKSVTAIDESAFEGCTGLTSINIPDSVTSIGDSAFYYCTGLTSITIPDSVTEIGEGAFSDCTGLTSITIPDSVTSIGGTAFYCTGLRNIKLPASLTNIGHYAFAECGSLQSVVIPEEIQSWEDDVFSGKKYITFYGKKGSYAEKYVEKTENMYYHPIDDNGFAYSENDDNTVSVIGYLGNDENIVIPNKFDGKNVSKIYSMNYSHNENVENITSITIPDSVTSIGENAFRNCTSLTSINVDKNNTEYSSDNGVVFNKNKTELLLCPIGKSGVYDIPYGVTSIAISAFAECKKLEKINMPDSLLVIGSGAFRDCESMKDIQIPDSVEQIGWKAFHGSGWFNEQDMDVVYIGNFLYYCGKARSGGEAQNPFHLVVRDGTKGTTDNMFYNSYPNYYGNLVSVTFPDTMTSIAPSTFGYATGNLETINVPDSVTKIGAMAFSGTKWSRNQPDGEIYVNRVLYSYKGNMPENTDISVKDGTVSISGSAFASCQNLKNIIIPDSVTEIGDYALGYYRDKYNHWNKLNNLTIYGTKGSCAETYANKNDIPFVSVNGYTNISTISTDEIVLGGTVTVNAKAILGDGDYTYAALYRKKTDTKWTVKQNYSTNDTITIKPAKATDYDVCVKVKDSTGKIVKKFFEVKVNAKLKNTSTISATTIKKGNTVTLNGSATGGMGGYTYAALYKKKAETKWTTRQGYKDNSEIIVRPYTNTDYDICIKVKDETGTIAKKYFTVTVTK